MSFVILTLEAILPLLLGLLLSVPLFLLLLTLSRNRSLRRRLRRLRVFNRHWQPQFLERVQPGEVR